MKKLLFISIISFFLLTIPSHGQSYYIGTNVGWHKDNFTITNNNGNLRQGWDILNLMGSLNFTYQFKNNIELTSGVSYYNLTCLVATRKMFGNSYMGINSLYDSENFDIPTLSLQCGIGYPLKLYKTLYFKINSGLEMDAYMCKNEHIGSEGGGMINNGQYYIINSSYPLNTHINLLICNKISLQYFTKSNVGIGVFASYSAGLFNVFDKPWGEYTWQEGNTFETIRTHFISNGSNWKWGIEVGYKFGEKDKNRH